MSQFIILILAGKCGRKKELSVDQTVSVVREFWTTELYISELNRIKMHIQNKTETIWSFSSKDIHLQKRTALSAFGRDDALLIVKTFKLATMPYGYLRP